MSLKPVLLHFTFDNVANLSAQVDHCIYSKVQSDVNGNKWSLGLYPGGKNSTNEQGWIALFLFSDNEGSINTTYSLSVKDANGEIVCDHSSDHQFPAEGRGIGVLNFLERSKVLNPDNNILSEGGLAIDVTIQIKDPDDYLYRPQDSIGDKMLDLLESEKNADVSFNVGGETFRAHSVIIESNAPILANCCDNQKDSRCAVIEGMKEKVFKIMLEYIYSGFVPDDEEALEFGKDLIDAANRYELLEMKMSVENVLVRERVLTKENVSDYILFADSHSCALLKEYAINFFLLHRVAILKSEHSKHLRESGELLSEILILTGLDKDDMTVAELRKELGDLRLDVDGSKETLIARLEEAKKEMDD